MVNYVIIWEVIFCELEGMQKLNSFFVAWRKKDYDLKENIFIKCVKIELLYILWNRANS